MSRAFDKKFGKSFLSELPTGPGVYSFFIGEMLVYVGKAKNLRRRLSQYKNASRLKKNRKMRAIVRVATSVRFETCASDLDACLREVKLIQDLQPKYNIASKFSFMYPMIGTRVAKGTLFLCLSTHPDKYPQYRFFGAFRSRRVTGDAYFSLFRLLRYFYNLAGKAELKREVVAKNSYVLGLRKVEPEMVEAIHDYLQGKADDLMGTLSLKLLEHVAARARREEVQTELDNLERFWRREAATLAAVLAKLSYGVYPVAQTVRDLLFLRAKVVAP